MVKRRKSKIISIGKVKIGGRNPVAVQSMTNTKTTDVRGTLSQIKRLKEAGCEIVRIAVPNLEAVKSLARIKKKSPLPVIADIHFDYRLAIAAINAGADKVRINPGNIGDKENVKEILKAAKKKRIPLRLGVNSGSLEDKILKKHRMHATPEALAESAISWIRWVEKQRFRNFVVSIKASDALRTIAANRILAKRCDAPLHLGVTEAGSSTKGTIWSSVGIGALLAEGIGDTIRVSLTGDPVKEIGVAWEILKSLDLRQRGITITSCPTCGRTEVDLVKIASKVERALAKIKDKTPRHVAVMGCVVNGPGEAREADVGVACGRGSGVIFTKGKILKTVKESDIPAELIKAIQNK